MRRQVPRLCEGDFVERAENLLAFGLPDRGKSHLVAAIDRIVHHATILELTGESFRAEAARGKGAKRSPR